MVAGLNHFILPNTFQWRTYPTQFFFNNDSQTVGYEFQLQIKPVSSVFTCTT